MTQSLRCLPLMVTLVVVFGILAEDLPFPATVFAGDETAAVDRKPLTDSHGDPLPSGAVARLGTVRLRCNLALHVAYSPDGKLVAAACEHGAAVFEIATGKLMHWLTENACGDAVRFSSDSKTLMLGGNLNWSGHSQSVRVQAWEVGTGKLLREVTGNEQETSSPGFQASPTRFSPDGKMLLMIDGKGKEVRGWDIATGKRTQTTKLEGGLTGVPTVSPDGKTLAHHSPDRDQVCLVELATGKRLSLLGGDPKRKRIGSGSEEQLTEWYNSFCFSPDSKFFAASGDALRVWDISNGKLQFLHKGLCTEVAFSPDGKILACDMRHAVSLFEVATGKVVREFKGCSDVFSFAFSPDGMILAVGERSRVSLWEVESGRPLHDHEGHRCAASCLAVSPDGTMLASGGGDRSLLIWDLRLKKVKYRFDGGAEGYYYGVTFSPAGKTIVTCQRDSQMDTFIRFIDLDSAKETHRLPAHKGAVHAIAFSPDGTVMVTAHTDNRIRVWDPKSGKELRHFPLEDKSPGDYTPNPACLTFSPDGKRLVVGTTDNHELSVWESDSWEKRWSHRDDQRNGYWGVTFSTDGDAIAAFTGDGVYLADAKTGRPLDNSEPPSSGAVRRPVWPNDQFILFRDKLWDVFAGRKFLELRSPQWDVRDSCVSADGKTIYTAGADTTILAWDTKLLQVAAARSNMLWSMLTANDKADVRRAVEALVAAPANTLPFIQRKVTTCQEQNRRIHGLIIALDDDEFEVRDKATTDLLALGKEAQVQMRRELRAASSVEVRKRLETVLAGIRGPQPPEMTPDESAILRAVEVVERIGTKEARDVLDIQANAPIEEPIAKAAKAALERLRKRSP